MRRVFVILGTDVETGPSATFLEWIDKTSN